MSTPSTVKVMLRIIGGATVAGLVLTGGYAVATEVATTERTEHVSVEADGLRSLVTRTDVGSIRVEQVTGARRVEIRVHSRGAWRLPSFSQHRSGDQLVVAGGCRVRTWFDDCRSDLVMRVPAGLKLKATSSVGNVRARGQFEQLSLESSTGNVTATNLRVPQVRVVSSVGNVELGFVEPPEDVDVTNSVGNSRVVVPDDGTAYDLHATTSVGSTRTAVPVDSSSMLRISVTSSVGNAEVITASDRPVE